MRHTGNTITILITRKFPVMHMTSHKPQRKMTTSLQRTKCWVPSVSIIRRFYCNGKAPVSSDPFTHTLPPHLFDLLFHSLDFVFPRFHLATELFDLVVQNKLKLLQFLVLLL